MDPIKKTKSVSRRDLLKLAGTAAAFCTSFGFLQGEEDANQRPSQRQFKFQDDPELRLKWDRTEIKWYSGGQVVHTSNLPPAVMKILQSDRKGIVQVKLYRAGKIHMNLGKIIANR